MRRVLGTLIAMPLLATITGIPAHAQEQTGEVSGVLFYDRNQDGEQQPNEPGGDTFSVELRTASGEHVNSAYTDENGRYRFADLAPGQYEVSFSSDGHVSTTPEDVPVTVKAGAAAAADFGIRGGKISGVAWEDVNGDGKRQPGEPAIAGIPIRMDGQAEPVARTDAQGRYAIHDLWVGGTTEYSVYFELRDGMTFSPPRIGDSATDSDVIDFDDGAAEATIWFGRPGMIDAAHIDAGYVRSS